MTYHHAILRVVELPLHTGQLCRVRVLVERVLEEQHKHVRHVAAVRVQVGHRTVTVKHIKSSSFPVKIQYLQDIFKRNEENTPTYALKSLSVGKEFIQF